MILAFDAGVVRRVEIEHQELLSESSCCQQVGVPFPSSWPHVVQDDGEGGVGEQGEGDQCVLEVAEVPRGDGPVGVERASGDDDELESNGDAAAEHDEEGLKVPEEGGGEPNVGCVGVGVDGIGLDVVEEVPEANEEESKARRCMASKGAHGREMCLMGAAEVIVALIRYASSDKPSDCGSLKKGNGWFGMRGWKTTKILQRMHLAAVDGSSSASWNGRVGHTLLWSLDNIIYPFT
ncbi:hypothetical protein ACLOJK_034757 [Asimina triloba]